MSDYYSIKVPGPTEIVDQELSRTPCNVAHPRFYLKMV